MVMSTTRRWIMATRPFTLLVGASPVLLGSALGIKARGELDRDSFLIFGLCMLAVLCLQTAANLVNDDADAGRGIDTATRRGPQRVTQTGLLASRQVRRAYYLLFGIAFLAAVVLASYGGTIIIALALLGMTVAYLYSSGPWPLSALGLGEALALVFFGPLAVFGCSYLQTLSYGHLELFLGLGCGLWSAALMAINNYRDRASDKTAGKRTVAVMCSDRVGYALAPACMIVAVGIMVWYGATSHHAGLLSSIALVFLGIILGPLARLLRHDDSRQNTALALTAFLTFAYSIILAVMVLL